MRNFAFIFLVFISFQCLGQSSFAPVGTYWNYYASHPFQASGYITVTVLKDTVISGRICKKLYDGIHGGISYIYKSNDSIFYSRFNHLSDLKYLYSFNMTVGQVMTPTDDPSWIVDSINILTIASFPRRVFYMTQLCQYRPRTEMLVENIGPLFSLLFWDSLMGCLSDPNIVVDGSSYSLHCFNDTQGSYPENCIPIAGIQKRANDFFTLSPNPANENFEIEFKDHKVE